MIISSQEQQKAREVVEKLKGVDSITNPQKITGYLRDMTANNWESLDSILGYLADHDEFGSRSDLLYVAFQKEVVKLLESKNKDEKILFLTIMLMAFGEKWGRK